MAVASSSVNEQTLTVSALAGDEEALGRLLAHHHQTAYNVAYRLLGREADACDAVQEAYLLTVRALRGDGAPPRDANRFEPWLRRVVANAALGQLRRRPSFPPVSVDDLGETLSGPSYGDPSQVAERREVRGNVLQALPDTQRAALVLREYQELAYDEIAETLGMSRSAVDTLLFRARRGFRAAYEGLTGEPRSVGCPELAPLLSLMVDDQVAPSAWPNLRDHLDRCPRCPSELEDLRRTRRLHALAPLVAVPAVLQVATAPAAAAAAAVAATEAAGVGIAGSAAEAGVGVGMAPAAAGAEGIAATVAQPLVGGLVGKLVAYFGARAGVSLVAAGIGGASWLDNGPTDLAGAFSTQVIVESSVRPEAIINGVRTTDPWQVELPARPPSGSSTVGLGGTLEGVPPRDMQPTDVRPARPRRPQP